MTAEQLIGLRSLHQKLAEFQAFAGDEVLREKQARHSSPDPLSGARQMG